MLHPKLQPGAPDLPPREYLEIGLAAEPGTLDELNALIRLYNLLRTPYGQPIGVSTNFRAFMTMLRDPDRAWGDVKGQTICGFNTVEQMCARQGTAEGERPSRRQFFSALCEAAEHSAAAAFPPRRSQPTLNQTS